MLIQEQIIPYLSQTIKFLFLPNRIRQIIFSILTGTNHISQLVMEEERQLRTQANALKYLYHIPFALYLKSDFVTISYQCDFTSNHSYDCHFLFSPRLISLMKDLNY